ATDGDGDDDVARVAVAEARDLILEERHVRRLPVAVDVGDGALLRGVHEREAGILGRQIGVQQIVEERAGAAFVRDRVAERDVRTDLRVRGKQRSGVAARAAGVAAAARAAAARARRAAVAADVRSGAAATGENGRNRNCQKGANEFHTGFVAHPRARYQQNSVYFRLLVTFVSFTADITWAR